MALVCNRYAKALFDLALQENAVDTYQEEVTAIQNIYTEEKDFQTFLLNPEIRAKDKKQVLQNIFQGRVQMNTLHFLMLLVDKDRIGYLSGICEEFVRICDREKNILNITVISSLLIEQEYLARISKKFKELYHAASIQVNTQVDPSLLGGIKVVVGDKLYDASMKEKLLELRSAMMV